MCGFVGYINKNFDPINPLTIKKMMQLQEHRGPDDKGLALFTLNNKTSVSYDKNDIKNLNTSIENSKFNGGGKIPLVPFFILNYGSCAKKTWPFSISLIYVDYF